MLATRSQTKFVTPCTYARPLNQRCSHLACRNHSACSITVCFPDAKGVIWLAQEKRNLLRETWLKLLKESYGSEVVVRFFVHCNTVLACPETEAHLGDIIYTHDGDEGLAPLAEGQAGVTQRVCMPTLRMTHAPEENTLCTWQDAEHLRSPCNASPMLFLTYSYTEGCVFNP